jgi:hypothetical protein
MPWYIAAAWGALGGFALELFGHAQVAIRGRGRNMFLAYKINWKIGATVLFIRALFGGLIGLGLNQVHVFWPYVLIVAGFVANYLLGMVARSVSVKPDEERASRVRSEAELLDSVRNPDRAPNGLSPDVGSILAARSSALADQLPLAGDEGGGSS